MLLYICMFVILHCIVFFTSRAHIPLLDSLPTFATGLPSTFIYLIATVCYAIYRARVCCHRPGKYMTQISAYLVIGGLNQRYSVDKGCSSPVGYRDCQLHSPGSDNSCM
jgi:hypothetical protein